MERIETIGLVKGIMNFGAMTRVDMYTLEQALDHVRLSKQSPAMSFLEIGIHDGNTARGVKAYADQWKMELDYWGVDNGAICNARAPFEGANFVLGDSAEVFPQIHEGFDIALIDGCHCFNHVILDTIHYSKRVRTGGFMLFHDTSPELQQTMRDPHGPDDPYFYNSVIFAHQAMGFPNRGWILRADEYERGAKIGGMRVFQKL